MPVDAKITSKQWARYAWVRDNGHTKFVQKHDKCERFFQGDQWDKTDRAILLSQRRPALTINKIISTVSNVLGEQIYNRAEISFRPRGKAPEATADKLSKVFKYISDNNQLDWKRSDMFADGIIGSRGFLDLRMDFTESIEGDIVIENLNPKNVLIDPDADSYDPDGWNEVFTTKWLTADDIAVLYNKADADILRGRDQSAFPYGYDSIEMFRDRFGDRTHPQYGGTYDQTSVLRIIRVIERQHRMLDKQEHFLFPKTGDTRPVPATWDRERIVQVKEKLGLEIIKKLTRRIRWTVTADNVVLHDDWSPYKHFTVIPYFPYFRRGSTVGLVENLIDPQELLNKTSSQELHIANTTANSGYKVKAGALTNMSIEELEERGAETGLVIEVNGDPDKDVVKITPNAVPTALDRISGKAEDHIDKISGVSESQKGFDREDVAAKAIQAKRQAGQTNLAKPLDSLNRTDYLLARNILDLVQEYMTEPRILTITKDVATGETEQVGINEPQEDGSILDDLTVGEYAVVVSSVPQRETLEDSQFEQARALKEIGIMIPDSVLIDSSRLRNKKEIIKQMKEIAEGPEAQAQAALQKRAQEAEITKTEAEAGVKQADTGLRQAKAQKEMSELQGGGDGAIEARRLAIEMDFKEREMALEERHKEQQMQLEREKAEQEMQLEREKAANDLQLKAQEAEHKMTQDRMTRMNTPATPGKTAK